MAERLLPRLQESVNTAPDVGEAGRDEVSQMAHATDEERAKFFDKHDSYFVE
ncbi:hypothetical protein [Streptomyces sp. NPDC058086]|uniref:hypothetical protein n=1 Tax=Streptomyces sp. NPDC058086 TaxID=3346334 RepID=UPI0036E8A765